MVVLLLLLLEVELVVLVLAVLATASKRVPSCRRWHLLPPPARARARATLLLLLIHRLISHARDWPAPDSATALVLARSTCRPPRSMSSVTLAHRSSGQAHGRSRGDRGDDSGSVQHGRRSHSEAKPH